MSAHWQRTGAIHVDGDQAYALEVETGTRDYHERWVPITACLARNGDCVCTLPADHDDGHSGPSVIHKDGTCPDALYRWPDYFGSWVQADYR